MQWEDRTGGEVARAAAEDCILKLLVFCVV